LMRRFSGASSNASRRGNAGKILCKRRNRIW
jgi:hypothetical protein